MGPDDALAGMKADGGEGGVWSWRRCLGPFSPKPFPSRGGSRTHFNRLLSVFLTAAGEPLSRKPGATFHRIALPVGGANIDDAAAVAGAEGAA